MNLTCFECGSPARHAHHVVPKSRGGQRTIPLCVACHHKAHAIDTATLQRESNNRNALVDDHEYRKECVWQYVNKNPRCSTRDIRDAGLYDGILPNMMYQELRSMVVQGYLIKQGKGKGHEHHYTTGQPFSTTIAEEIRHADAARISAFIARAQA